jgi:hypothetical protein
MIRQKPNPNPQKLEKSLVKVREIQLPSVITQIVREVEVLPNAPQELIEMMNQGKYVRECYQLLKHLNISGVTGQLESLLDSPDKQVRHAAMWILADMENPPKSAKLTEALSQWLEQIPCPPETETHCIEMLKVIENLARIGSISTDIAERLQSILLFIPRRSYREVFWPRTWVVAARLLRKLDYIDKLKEIADTQKPHYLSTAGAIALAINGATEGSVLSWLKNHRDYHLLTDTERQELETILCGVGATGPELAELGTLAAAGD